MASRTKLIGVQEYDRNGSLDWFICGSQWIDWYGWRKKSFEENADPAFVKGAIKQELMNKFERAVDVALNMGAGDGVED